MQTQWKDVSLLFDIGSGSQFHQLAEFTKDRRAAGIVLVYLADNFPGRGHIARRFTARNNPTAVCLHWSPVAAFHPVFTEEYKLRDSFAAVGQKPNEHIRAVSPA